MSKIKQYKVIWNNITKTKTIIMDLRVILMLLSTIIIQIITSIVRILIIHTVPWALSLAGSGALQRTIALQGQEWSWCCFERISRLFIIYIYIYISYIILLSQCMCTTVCPSQGLQSGKFEMDYFSKSVAMALAGYARNRAVQRLISARGPKVGRPFPDWIDYWMKDHVVLGF